MNFLLSSSEKPKGVTGYLAQGQTAALAHGIIKARFVHILVDMSGSMTTLVDEVKKAIKAYYESLIVHENNSNVVYVMQIATFNEEIEFAFHWGRLSEVPIHNFEDIYKPNKYTRLYDTVEEHLAAMLKLYNETDFNFRKNSEFVFAVFTDGEDNASVRNTTKDTSLLRQVSAEALRTEQFTLLTYGIGIDAGRVAAAMGFPTGEPHAVTVEHSGEGVERMTSSLANSTIVCPPAPKTVPHS